MHVLSESGMAVGSLMVAAVEVFGLLGPNGAGKSTTIGMLTTTIVPTAGTALLADYDVAKQPLLARAMSSVVFQDAVVDRTLSGRENLELHARLWGVDRDRAKRRIDELVEALGIDELIQRPVDSYSGGQRRRLEIARALVSNPRVLFLDEPTVGLDPRIRHELLDVIGGLRAREEMTIMLTTHYLDEAERLCDRVAIIHLGEIVALDTPRRLLGGLGHEILEFRIDGNPDAALAALHDRGMAGDDAFAVGARITVPLHDAAVADALAAIDTERLRASEALASRVTKEEDYVAATRVLAILPFFFAGALFPISAMPGALTAVAKVLPLTHALALMRYGLIDPSGRGLHDIWGMNNVTTEAWLSLAVVALYAVALTVISIRVFSGSAVH